MRTFTVAQRSFTTAPKINEWNQFDEGFSQMLTNAPALINSAYVGE